MKDNELREVLLRAGTIGAFCMGGGVDLTPVFLDMKINAIIEYLGIDLKKRKEGYVATKREAAKIENKNVIIRCTKCLAELPAMKAHEPDILWFEPHQCDEQTKKQWVKENTTIGRCGEAHCGHNCGMCLIADVGSSWVIEKRKAEMAIRKQMAKEEELSKQKENKR